MSGKEEGGGEGEGEGGKEGGREGGRGGGEREEDTVEGERFSPVTLSHWSQASSTYSFPPP